MERLMPVRTKCISQSLKLAQTTSRSPAPACDNCQSYLYLLPCPAQYSPLPASLPSCSPPPWLESLRAPLRAEETQTYSVEVFYGKQLVPLSIPQLLSGSLLFKWQRVGASQTRWFPGGPNCLWKKALGITQKATAGSPQFSFFLTITNCSFFQQLCVLRPHPLCQDRVPCEAWPWVQQGHPSLPLSLHLPSSPTSPVGGLLLLLQGQLETGQEAEGRNINFYFKVLCEKKFALPKLGIKP